jgi:hypothetical protein
LLQHTSNNIDVPGKFYECYRFPILDIFFVHDTVASVVVISLAGIGVHEANRCLEDAICRGTRLDILDGTAIDKGGHEIGCGVGRESGEDDRADSCSYVVSVSCREQVWT